MPTTKKINVFALWCFVLSGIGLLFLLLSSYGLFKTFLSWDADQAGIAWKLLGTIFVLLAGYLFYKLAARKILPKVGHYFLLLALLGLSVAANTGFKLTGGDIKQRVTFINMDGKITDIKGFTKYYSDFYHLDTDTALVNYINTYHELPGVNLWAYNICCAPAETRHPRSTAPRANEEFEWHTGAYEMDLDK